MNEDNGGHEERSGDEAFRELANAAPAILWETGPGGHCTFISRGWTDLSGQPGDEAMGFGWLDVLHSDDRDRARTTFVEANEGRLAFQVEYRIRHRDGAYRWAIAAGRPRFDHSGEFLGYAGSTVDVDALKRAETELAASKTRMRFAAEVAQVGTFDWNIQTGSNTWSPEIEKIYGLEPGTFPGTYEAWRDLVHPEDREVAEGCVQAALGTDGFGAEWRIIRADGVTRWIEARARVFRDIDGRPLRMIGVNLDITDRKLAEETLRDAARRKDRFLAMLAHELRNPLAPIRNAAAILQRVGPDEKEVFEKTTAMIERQVSYLARLTDDLLDVSRIASGKIRVERRVIEVREIVADAVEDYRPYLEVESGLSLTTDLAPEPVWVEGDKVRIAQAVGNLLNNAGKFTDPGGTVEVVLEADGDSAVIRVRDSGVGISEELLDRLFDPFSQDDDLGRNPGGLGLGLALVRGFAELHGGSATASSRGTGRGSEFAVRLPTVDPSEGGWTTQEPSGAGGAATSIVLIEDSPDVAESLAMYLDLHGHTVHVAGDGAAGIELVRRVGPDVILCDLGLPGDLDGIAVAKALRAEAEFQDTRLIALTGYGQAKDRDRTAEAGFDMHLLKPVDLDRLGELLRQAARSRKGEQEIPGDG